MGAAISLFVLMSVSIFVTRVASVALRHTGLEDSTAKFQALSAISGTGYTTKEAEAIVNYPVRRKIVMMLMIIGNLGVVTVMATLVVSFVNTEGDAGAIVTQLVWLVVVLGLLWFFILNKTADRWMSAIIGRFISQTTFLGKRHFTRLLQIGNGYSVCQHPIVSAWFNVENALTTVDFERLGLQVLSTHSRTGDISHSFESTALLTSGDSLIVYGADEGHDQLEIFSLDSESESERAAHRH